MNASVRLAARVRRRSTRSPTRAARSPHGARRDGRGAGCRCARTSRPSSSRASWRPAVIRTPTISGSRRWTPGTGELLDVVCGAPNVTAGKLYPFAPAGTTMPGGIKIEKRKIRGDTSNGMLCSARELGLGEDHEGIMELDVDVRAGHAVPRRDADRRYAPRRRRAAEPPGPALAPRARARGRRGHGQARWRCRTIRTLPARDSGAATRSRRSGTTRGGIERARRGRRQARPTVHRRRDPRREGRAEPGLARASDSTRSARARSTTSSTPRTTCCTSSDSRSHAFDLAKTRRSTRSSCVARRRARRWSRSTASSARSPADDVVIADAIGAAGDGRRHGRARHRGRPPTTTDLLHRGRELRSRSRARRAARARALDRRQLSVRARRRLGARARGARARRSL